MANRRFEMFHYRQIIHRMRMGESDRAIAKTKIIGRFKCGHVRAVAEKNGWLGSMPLPDDAELAAAFETEPNSQSHSGVPQSALRTADPAVDRARGLLEHHS